MYNFLFGFVIEYHTGLNYMNNIKNHCGFFVPYLVSFLLAYLDCSILSKSLTQMRMHVFLFLHIVDVVQFTNEGASWCKYPIKHTNLILM